MRQIYAILLGLLSLSACEGPDPSPAVNAKFAKILQTSEAGDSASFTLALNSEPTSDVTINITASDDSEAMVIDNPVTFTPSNWKSPRTVTVKGKDDNLPDGDIPYFVIVGAAKSADSNYNGLFAQEIPAINLDDENFNNGKFITVSPLQIQTGEDGQSAIVNVSLSKAPNNDNEVHLNIQSDNDLEGFATPSELTFTANDWSDKIFTVKGRDDNLVDGNIQYHVNLTVSASSDAGHLPLDPDYATLSPDAVGAINIDNDQTPAPGILVNPLGNLITSENGDRVQIEISLAAAPSDTVSLDIVSSNLQEGVAEPTQISFDASNFAVTKKVTIIGKNDFVADGDQSYTISIDPSASADPDYAALSASSLSFTNSDNDPEPPAAVSIQLLDASSDENGGSGQLTLVLDAVPSAPVTIDMQSSLSQEASPVPASVTFDDSNWRQPRNIDIIGQDDDVADGNIDYTIQFTTTSSDSRYDKLSLPAQALSNADNEIPGFVFTPASGVTTSEAGSTADIQIVLAAKPIANDTVTISATVGNPAEGKIAPGTLNFDQSNWNQPQTFTVTGLADNVVDGDISYDISFSVSAANNNPYNALSVPVYPVTNLDTTVPASPALVVTAPSALSTSENLTSDNFSVVLQSQPSAPVTLDLSSSLPTEASVSPALITFTSDSGGVTSWNTAQTITVTGVDDSVVDGAVGYQINLALSSSDSAYNGMSVPSVSGSNLDNDLAAIVVSPETNLQTSETGTSVVVNVSLAVAPAALTTVSVNASSDNTAEGVVQSPSTLSFNDSNWNTPQALTIQGQPDNINDGNVIYHVNFIIAATPSTNPYNGATHAPLQITNLDNPLALPSITVSAASPLQTSEPNIGTSFTVVLNSQPATNVTLSASSSDASEAVVSPTSVTFTAGANSNWQTPQSFTVTGQDDTQADGNIAYSIDFNVTGAQAPTSIAAINLDDEQASLVVNSSGTQTNEAGGTAGSVSVGVALGVQPALGSTITVAAGSNNSAEASVSPASLSFNDSDWNIAKNFTIQGVDDNIADGNITYAVNFNVSAGTIDNPYHGIAVSPLALTNVDNDFISVTALPGQVSDASGESISLLVSLLQTPPAAINLVASSSNASAAKTYPRDALDQALAVNFSPSSALDVAQVIRVVGQVPASPITVPIDYQVSFNLSGNSATNLPVQTPGVLNFQQVDAAPTPPATDAVAATFIETSGNSDIDPLNPKFKLMANDGSMVEATGVETFSDKAAVTNILSGCPITLSEGQNFHWQLLNDHLDTHGVKIYRWWQDTLNGGEMGRYHFAAPAAGTYLIGSHLANEQAIGLVSTLIVRPALANTAWNGGPAFDREYTWLITDMDSSWIKLKLNATDPDPTPNAQNTPDVQLVNGRNYFNRTDANDTRLVAAAGEVLLLRVLNGGIISNTISFPNPGATGVKEISRNGVHVSNIANVPESDSVTIAANETVMLLYTIPNLALNSLNPVTLQNTIISQNSNYASNQISQLEIVAQAPPQVVCVP